MGKGFIVEDETLELDVCRNSQWPELAQGRGNHIASLTLDLCLPLQKNGPG